MQTVEITVRLADVTVEKIQKIIEMQRELHPEIYANQSQDELMCAEFRNEAEEYFDRETSGKLRFWQRRLIDQERGRETSWTIRWENGSVEAAGTDLILARCRAEEKAKENGMSYIIA